MLTNIHCSPAIHRSPAPTGFSQAGPTREPGGAWAVGTELNLVWVLESLVSGEFAGRIVVDEETTRGARPDCRTTFTIW